MERKPEMKSTRPAAQPAARQSAPSRPAPQAAAAKVTPAVTSAAAASAAEVDGPIEDDGPDGLFGQIKTWFAEEAGPYTISAIVHAVIFLVLGLTLGVTAAVSEKGDAPKFEEVAVEEAKEEEETKEEEPEFKPFEIKEPDIEQPEEIDPTVTEQKAQEAQDAVYYDDSKEFEEAGGGGFKDAPAEGPQLGGPGTDFRGLKPGPASKGPGGVGGGHGFGDKAGSGGEGNGFGGRGKGSREAMVARYGGTKSTERAVAAALLWLARHQNRDGSWQIEKFMDNCKGDNYTKGAVKKCEGPGSAKSDSGATALGLLPFLGAGQTHNSKGMYQATVRNAIDWLIKHQKPNGDLSAGTPHVMYSHGLAAIAMCEAYAMTQDSRLQFSAQAACKFIEDMQGTDGGWRYKGKDPEGDTSVVGWQLMALKSGQMAKLKINPKVLEDVEKKWLASVSAGDANYMGRFKYQKGRDGNLYCMTAVGLLIREYMGCAKEDPGLTDGIDYLLTSLPHGNDTGRNIYYWYYGTQVIHHVLGERWDKWNRAMRRALVETQVKGTGCDAGSWDPKPDLWGGSGGRVMITSLSCLTLEVYYRHLPLYDLDKQGPKGKKPVGEKPDAKAAAGKAKPEAPKADAPKADAKGKPAPKGNEKAESEE